MNLRGVEADPARSAHFAATGTPPEAWTYLSIFFTPSTICGGVRLRLGYRDKQDTQGPYYRRAYDLLEPGTRGPMITK